MEDFWGVRGFRDLVILLYILVLEWKLSIRVLIYFNLFIFCEYKFEI